MANRNYSNKPKRDVAQEITNHIITAIENGANGKDFKMPWHGAKSMPINAATNNFYNGVNVINLWMANFPSNTFATYKQWNDIGAQVEKGSKGFPVVFYSVKEKQTEDKDKPEKYMILKYSTVFAAEQVSGYELPTIENTTNLVETQDHAETFFFNTGVNIKHGENRAYYVPSKDFVNMPPKNVFIDTTSTATENYYSTLAHECTHATGHDHRLGRRKEIQRKYESNQKRAYAFEELVAELGAAYLMAYLGLEATPRLDHAQYIESWLSVLKEDKRAILKAGSLASKALDWMQAKQDMVQAA
ncbi:ArdC family protein [Pseudomonadota bacterium]